MLVMAFRAWSRRPLPLALNPLAARGDMLAATKDGTSSSSDAGGVASANNGHIAHVRVD
jgi:hypothetical protein